MRDDYEREWETRKKRIDTRLTALGWTVAPFVPGILLANCNRYALAEYPTANGPADYALVVNGRILGIVEAKKLTLGPQSVLVQAGRYSRGLEGSPFDFHGHYVPFLCSTNGEVLWFHDVRHPLARSRRIATFHTPAALTPLGPRPLYMTWSYHERNGWPRQPTAVLADRIATLLRRHFGPAHSRRGRISGRLVLARVAGGI
jgi:type I site-specific restriction endonuclease